LKKIARRLVRTGSLMAAAGAAVTLFALPATASAASVPLTITETTSSPEVVGSTNYENVGVTFGITYTIKDNVSTPSPTTFTDVGFTDALPPFVTLDDEVGETAKGCGTPFNATNQPGQDYVTETGLTVANGTNCTITVEVVSSTPVVAASDAFSGATYTNASTTYTQTSNPSYFGLTPLVLTIAADPTFSITGVTPGATYTPGQNVVLGFSATAAANDSIPAGDVLAEDDQGNTLTEGQAINTLVPGTHQVEVIVETLDGYEGSQTVSYNVSSPSLTAVKTTKAGSVDFSVKFLAPGSVVAQLLDGKTVVAKVSKKVSAGKNTAFATVLTAAGKKLLAKSGKKGIKVKLTVLYAATNWTYVGTQPLITRTGITLKPLVASRTRR